MITPGTSSSEVSAERYPKRTNGSGNVVSTSYGPVQPGCPAGSAPNTWSYARMWAKPSSSTAAAYARTTTGSAPISVCGSTTPIFTRPTYCGCDPRGDTSLNPSAPSWRG